MLGESNCADPMRSIEDDEGFNCIVIRQNVMGYKNT